MSGNSKPEGRKHMYGWMERTLPVIIGLVAVCTLGVPGKLQASDSITTKRLTGLISSDHVRHDERTMRADNHGKPVKAGFSSAPANSQDSMNPQPSSKPRAPINLHIEPVIKVIDSEH